MMDRTSPNTAPVICFPAVPATKIFVAACVVLIAWGAVIRILWNDWRIDPQYSYGILVPLLVLGLLVKRWEDRPATAPVGRWDGCFAMICILASAVVLALASLGDCRRRSGSRSLAFADLYDRREGMADALCLSDPVFFDRSAMDSKC